MTFQKLIQEIDIQSETIYTTKNILNELFNIENELYENPAMSIESLLKTANFAVKNMPYSTARNIVMLRADILKKMKKHKEKLDNFTPIIEEQPKVLVMDVASSRISNVATPIMHKTPQQIEEPVMPMQKHKEKVKKERPVAPCKPGKERNANGRCVNIKTVNASVEKVKLEKVEKVKKGKPIAPCKPGKERNANGRCVNIKTVKKILKTPDIPVQVERIALPNTLSIHSASYKTKNISKKKEPCKPGKERNANGRCVKIQTAKNTKRMANSKTLKNI